MWIVYVIAIVYLSAAQVSGQGFYNVEDILTPEYTYNISGSFHQRLKVSLCQSLGYRKVSLPNLLHQKNQSDIDDAMFKFRPLIASGCSKHYLIPFLCSLYAPVYFRRFKFPLPPCRPLCKRAKRECIATLQKYHYGWPRRLRCRQFPRATPYGICVTWKFGKQRYKVIGKLRPEELSKWKDIFG